MTSVMISITWLTTYNSEPDQTLLWRTSRSKSLVVKMEILRVFQKSHFLSLFRGVRDHPLYFCPLLVKLYVYLVRQEELFPNKSSLDKIIIDRTNSKWSEIDWDLFLLWVEVGGVPKLHPLSLIFWVCDKLFLRDPFGLLLSLFVPVIPFKIRKCGWCYRYHLCQIYD